MKNSFALKLTTKIIIIMLSFYCTNLFAQNEELINQMKFSLTNEVLDIWYPRTIDTTYGGFLTDFNYKWEMNGPQNKMLVSQARHVWTTSNMAEFLEDTRFKGYAEHGYNFLKTKMYDAQYKGFYLIRNREGDETINYGNFKSAYSNSFAIYSLAAYYKISKNEEALNLAKETFLWLEKHAHDPINKGYYDLLNRDGSLQELKNTKEGNRYSVNPKWKDQNSSIHLLEAFTELYSVWKDDLLKERLTELLYLVRDVITNEKGSLTLYLTDDWQVISFKDSSAEVREANHYLDHVSFGHDVETAYLMLEAEHVLYGKNDLKTLTISKKMIDNSLTNGWDNNRGGLYYEGYYFSGKSDIEIIDSSKVWWVQAEALNAFLLMSKLFPNEKIYYQSFLKEWEYINKYLIDHENKGWYSAGLDQTPQAVNFPKAYDWKANYHNVRSLMNCIKILSEN